MKRALDPNLGPLLALLGAALLAGCTAKSLKKVTDDPVTDETNWQSGQDITIENDNGRTEVRADGSGTRVSARVTRETFIAYDADAESAGSEFRALELIVAYDDENEAVVVDAEKNSGTTSYTAAEMDVTIPDAFDGRLDVWQGNGPVSVYSVADATRVDVTSENGSCQVDAGSAAYIRVDCDGTLEARVRSVPDDFDSAQFETGLGDIELRMPSSGVYSVAAVSEGGGLVDTTGVNPSRCDVEDNGDSSKRVSCNGATDEDPVYWVKANSSLSDTITIVIN